VDSVVTAAILVTSALPFDSLFITRGLTFDIWSRFFNAMSTNNLSLEEVTKKTIDILSRIIKKAPLTHKLLSKPPFRYLHDLFSEIIKISGFATGLYQPHEMNHENIKDKDSKISYLSKMIEMIRILG
jgi:hypothetical protein